MLIDTHAHVTFSAFKEDAQEVMQRAFEVGVTVVNVGTQLDTSKQAVEMAEKYNANFLRRGGFNFQKPAAFAVVGLHPVHTYSQHVDEEESHFTTREEKFDYEAYKKLAENPLVVGIGECGLDYYRLPGNREEAVGSSIEDIKQGQKDVFIAQIRLAKELDKALVIHCRPSEGSQDAYLDILSILDSEISNLKSEIRFEIHSFTGSPAIVKEFVRRGAYVGVNGIITFDKTGNMAEVIKAVPLEKIVLETDCPYLTPVPHRGKKNEPAYVMYVAQKVAELKGVSVDEVARVTSQNAADLFRLRRD